jgi:fermentation-respiration switch protein FrsA (DUF1100 family)
MAGPEMPMRTDTSFHSHGQTCRAWLYRPDTAIPAPAILMSHGFSAVKEQGLDGFAQAFCAAGFVVLVFDYRFLGASDGTPRGRIVPHEQHDDLRAALDVLSRQPYVDPARIGIWGSSYSGGHALFLGALDPRIKVIVAQVPAISGAHALAALAGREGLTQYLTLLAQDHALRNAGEPGASIPIVAQAGTPSVLSTPDSLAWFTSSAETAPHWLNQTSLDSVARLAEYTPAALIDLIAPKPLLIQAGLHDSLIPIAQIRDAFARAGEPKKLTEYNAGHFDLYTGAPLHETAAAEATAWFRAHL